MSLQPVLTFDGIDDYIEVPYSEKHNLKVFTISCWVKPTKVTINGLALLYQQVGGQTGYGLFLKTTNWYFHNAKYGFLNSSLAPVLNIWTHFAATCDGSKVKIYTNGQATGESISSSTPSYNSAILGSLSIGVVRVGSPYAFFAGQIAEVCIWNKARTQQEIQLDMKQRLTGKEEGLVGYWPLNEGSGNTAIDKTGNGKNGIMKGGLTWKQEEIPLNPAEPTTGGFQVPTTSINGVEFTNKLTTDISYNFTPSGTWKPKADIPECTAAGLKGFPPELQTPYNEALKPSQQYLKYQNNTYFALLAVNKTTGVVTEVAQKTTIVLKPGETLTFLVNDFTPNYGDNTGTLTVKWSAT
jgi:hypothetical protein